MKTSTTHSLNAKLAGLAMALSLTFASATPALAFDFKAQLFTYPFVYEKFEANAQYPYDCRIIAAVAPDPAITYFQYATSDSIITSDYSSLSWSHIDHRPSRIGDLNGDYYVVYVYANSQNRYLYLRSNNDDPSSENVQMIDLAQEVKTFRFTLESNFPQMSTAEPQSLITSHVVSTINVDLNKIGQKTALFRISNPQADHGFYLQGTANPNSLIKGETDVDNNGSPDYVYLDKLRFFNTQNDSFLDLSIEADSLYDRSTEAERAEFDEYIASGNSISIKRENSMYKLPKLIWWYKPVSESKRLDKATWFYATKNSPNTSIPTRAGVYQATLNFNANTPKD